MVTGGAGFIGGHITELLVSQGHEVVVFDNFSTGNIDNLEDVESKIEVVIGDIRDLDALRESMEGIDHVIHHAAEISVVKSVDEPEFVNQVNVGGTVNVLVAARERGVKRVVLASSSAIYGDTGKQPQREDFLPDPMSPYGASKIAGEYYLSCFHHLYGLETVRLRYFNVFGPRQNPKSQYAAVIPKFIDRILAGQEIHIYGDGEQTRDFVFVKNVARANLLACTAPEAAGKVFNIASEQTVSVNELARMLIEMAGREIEVIHDDAITGEIRYSASDITQARKVLGFEPSVSFADGLKLTFDYFAAKAGQT
jgi:nucleoside-diphosphate-sugar epimerase